MSNENEQPLTSLVNVGRGVDKYFESISRRTVGDLVGADPDDLFEQMCEAAGSPLDPCLLDTVVSAVDQANGLPAKPWWEYTARRKADETAAAVVDRKR